MLNSLWPNIDPRIHGVGTTKLRQMTSKELRKLEDNIYIIQDNEERLAVLVSFNNYIKLQELAKKEKKENNGIPNR